MFSIAMLKSRYKITYGLSYGTLYTIPGTSQISNKLAQILPNILDTRRMLR